MLIDRATIEIRSGKGGDGHISFLHDKTTEYGGPDGGNGGRGGSIYFRSTHNLNSLYNFRHGKVFTAEDGENGTKRIMAGKNGKDLFIEVPQGTVIYDEKTGEILADLKEDGRTVLLAPGGRGGRGNASFKSSRRRIPRIATNGEKGLTIRLKLVLKSLVDGGIVGFPSAGKSTFINVVTKANALVGDYPFTTLSPNLGVYFAPDMTRYILSDVPGLIEGASEGRGLGTEFLRHIERCRVLLHLVSMAGNEEQTPIERYRIIRNELTRYGARLDERPEIVIASKMDEEGAEERFEEFKKQVGKKVYPLSSFTHQGLDAILKEFKHLADTTPEFTLYDENDFKRYTLQEKEDDIVVKKEAAHLYRLEGKIILDRYEKSNLKNAEGINHFLRFLDSLDIDAILEKNGIEDGDEVVIGDFSFIFYK